jgi:hypothetical protein
VDFGANLIVVRGGKGDRDRRTMLPATVKPDLVRHLAEVRAQHQADLAADAGWVELPTALARKYPHAGREWVWQWVFPATRRYVDRTTGERRRHHLHETVLQRAHGAGAPGTPGRDDDDDLHPRSQPRPGRRAQPRRSNVRRVIPHRCAKSYDRRDTQPAGAAYLGVSVAAACFKSGNRMVNVAFSDSRQPGYADQARRVCRAPRRDTQVCLL